MSTDIATATQFVGEHKRHILDFSPAMLPGETAGQLNSCDVITENGSGTMQCVNERIHEGKSDPYNIAYK